jgi:hypothetical protein
MFEMYKSSPNFLDSSEPLNGFVEILRKKWFGHVLADFFTNSTGNSAAEPNFADKSEQKVRKRFRNLRTLSQTHVAAFAIRIRVARFFSKPKMFAY